MEPAVGTLTETQIFEAARTLARAFQNDPFEKYVFPDDEERAQRSSAHFSPFVRLGYLYGEVLTTVGLTGVSVWLPPGSEPTADQALQSGFRQLPDEGVATVAFYQLMTSMRQRLALKRLN